MRPGAIVSLAALLGAANVPAQPFPTKPMRMIVPAPPGGSSDIMGRLVAEHLQRRYGQPVITENRAGAGQTIGTNFVAKSEPDGHTLLMVTVSHAVNSAVYPKLPYDPVADLTGVAMVGTGPLLLVVHPSLPVRSVRELIAFARARPGRLDYGSSGSGTIPHLAGELFAARTNTDILHVPYKGIAASVTAAASGEAPMIIVSIPAAGPMLKANRLRALAVTTAQRSSFMPELPTLAESGVPDYDVATWWAVLAPGKTPANIVMRLNEDIRKNLAMPDAASILAANGATPALDMTPERLNALIKSEVATWGRVARERKITVN